MESSVAKNFAEFDIYDAYKPLRNFLRKFSLVPSLSLIWLLSEHILNNKPLPFKYNFRADNGELLPLKTLVFPWDLEILCRELILNAGNEEVLSLSKTKDLGHAINLIRDIEEEISIRSLPQDDILLELHRIIHRQFPWQKKNTQRQMIRYLKVYGEDTLTTIIRDITGMNMREYFYLSLAVTGSFLNNAGLSKRQDYGIIDIAPQQTAAFFERLSIPLPELKKRFKSLEQYGRNWLYTWNPLIERPLISIDEKFPDRLICPMPRYVLDRTTRGVFYDIVNAEKFSDAFGPSFQKYVGDVIVETCTNKKFTLHKEAEYKDGKKKKHGVDWILSDPHANLFIECKTKRMSINAKFLITRESLEEDLKILARTIVQNYKNIKDALAGKTAWEINSNQIFPVIVTLEEWLIFSPRIIDQLNKFVSEGLLENNIQDNYLEDMPYTIASIDAFEYAAQIVNQVGIGDFFQLKTEKNNRSTMLQLFAHEKFKELRKNVPQILFKEDWERMMPIALQKNNAN